MKKTIAILLTLVILIPTLSTVSSAYYTGGIGFVDVREQDWYYHPVYNAWIKEYVFGMVNEKGERVFRPNDTLTRAQFMQMLAQSSVDLFNDTYYKTVETGFEDVKTTHWYNAAIAWGVEKGIVKGVSETRFAPNEPITREQVARMLYLFVEYKGYNMDYTDDLSAFTDAEIISDWALSQMQWAVASNIIKGYGDGELRPRRNTTRAEICVMLEALETYFKYDGPMFRDGAFAAICDYITENGEFASDGRIITHSIITDASVLRISCSNTNDYIYINCDRQNDGLKESLYFNIEALTDGYYYTYQQSIPKNETEFDFPYVVTADITIDGLTDIDYIYGNYTDAEKAEQWQSLHEEFMTVFTELLESLGYTYEDLFR